MGKMSFYKAVNMLKEVGEAPGGLGGGLGGPSGPGSPPGGLGGPGGGLGGPMGGPPPMGGGAMGGMGGGMGGMGGGMGDPMGGPQGQPIPIKTIPAADVWGLLEKILKSNKNEKFFDEISINKQQPQTAMKQPERKSSLLK